MSYYYEDTSYDQYNAPVHYVDTHSHYDYTPATTTYTHYDDAPSYVDNTLVDPTYYDDTPADHTYYVDIQPSADSLSYEDISTDPAYYDDTPLDPSYYVEAPSYDNVAHSDTLQSYVEEAANRIYTYDEIHPAYRDNYEDSVDTQAVESSHDYATAVHPLASIPDTRIYSDDETHLLAAYVPDPNRSSYYNDYIWIRHNTVDGPKYDPPSNPSFYVTTSHNHASDDDLTETAELIEAVLEEWDVQNAVDHGDLINGRKPRHDQLMQIAQHIGIIQRQRNKQCAEDEVWEDHNEEDKVDDKEKIAEDENVEDLVIYDNKGEDDGYDHPQPTPLVHHPTPAFLITAPKHRERRYHLGPHVRRRRPSKPKAYNHRNNTRTTPPPDIRLPKPHPISPNIYTQPRIHSLQVQTPPDIHAPRPLPQKPNIPIRPPIFQQPRHPLQRRPCRKHPPHLINQVYPLIPHHYHNVVRRILKRATCTCLDVRGRTSLEGG